MKDKEPTDEIYIVLEKDHDDGSVFCDICGALTTKGHQRFEQWGSKVRIVAENFPIYTCPNDGIVTAKPNVRFGSRKFGYLPAA